MEYDLADERGIVVWAENGHSNPAAWTPTGDQITREMVRQNYNHPSICFWSIGNEALLKLLAHPNTADLAALEHYGHVARSEDPGRLITYASSTLFHESPALDFVAVNRYYGWYGGLISSFEPAAVFYHYVSETGAGGVITTHTADWLPSHTVNFYEPEEYQQEVAEARCQTAFRNAPDQIAMLTWWTFRDFGDPRYKGLNTKGIETYGGFRKDIFYLFQSFLRPDTPVVHVCGKPWFLRRQRSPFDRVRRQSLLQRRRADADVERTENRNGRQWRVRAAQPGVGGERLLLGRDVEAGPQRGGRGRRPGPLRQRHHLL